MHTIETCPFSTLARSVTDSGATCLTTQGAEEARAAQQATSAEIERQATEVSQLATANAEAAQR